MAIKFNNTDLPSFVKINDIKVSMLPTISQNTVKVNGKAGLIDFGNEIGEREIEVNFTIISSSPSDLKTKIRTLAEYLYTDEEKQLVLLDEPSKYYMAKISGETDIDEIINVGQGTFTFLCTDPYAYSIVEKEFAFKPMSVNQPDTFVNEGSVETFPEMEFTFDRNVTAFTVVGDDEFMMFGKPRDVDRGIVDTSPIVLEDPMDNPSKWATIDGLDDGNKSGAGFTTNGWSFSVSDFGTSMSGRWHGASALRGLSRQVQDFKARARIGMVATSIGQLGRVQMYLLDANNNHIAMISMRNGNPSGLTPYAQVRLGTNYTNEFILETYGDYAGVWQPFNDGFLDISRRGNKWEIFIAIYDEANQRTHTTLYKSFIDVNNLYMNKVASVQIHIGAFGDTQVNPPAHTMYIQHVRVTEIKDNPPENKQDPYVFHTGDVLNIDSETAEIRLNGEPYYETLDPSSKFITMKKGSNSFTFSPTDDAMGSIKYKERWL